MTLDEQEITNAICLHFAQRKQVKPEEVDVQLMWDEELGFSAEIWVGGRSQYLVEANLLEAIERYVLDRYDLRVFRNQIQLTLEDEIQAIVNT